VSSKIGFIADYFDTIGGAEQNDSVLLNHLISRYDVKKILSRECTVGMISDLDFVVVGNFVQLSEDVKEALSKRKNYIIYEHDHKYVITRDPSKYADFEIPKEHLINVKFFKNAQKVICLGKKQVEIINKNLGLNDTCVSIGTSLWSQEALKRLSDLQKSKSKNGKAAIFKSNNAIKNTRKSIDFCKSNKIDYDLIHSSDPDEFLSMLSSYDTLVFFPGVLESLSRLVVEAKILDCKIITTPKMLGASYEDWFSLKGQQLLAAISNNVKKALSLFETEIDRGIGKSKQKEKEITAILTCYRRPEYLEEQVMSLRNQTVPPKEIWLWVNDHEENRNFNFDSLQVDKIVRNNHNWKFHGRFALAQLCRTRYVALFDDDTIPGTKWFSNCLNNIETQPGIYGGVGVILNDKRYYGHSRVGWSNPNEVTVEVDLVGHAWFFEKSTIQYMWREEPFTWENGEDIQFSFLAKKYGHIRTFVPPHPKQDKEMFSSLKGLEYGVDEKATSNPKNHKVFYSERDNQVIDHINNGWVTVKEVK
jgi:hypothetical protein